MVSSALITSSNDRIKSTLPSGLVAVFVGATNGVGETTVKQFSKHAIRPRVYITGRSQEAGDPIVAESKAFNPEGEFIFIKHETSLMRNVDAVCNEIASKEEAVNLLFLTVGTLQIGMKTEEGLHYPMALTVHARSRFVSNLLPLIRRGKGLRRVVSTYGATNEGRIYTDDFQGYKMGRMANYGHMTSIVDFDLEAHHKTAPEVSFVHNFPGAVESGIARGQIGPLMRTLKTIFAILGPLVHIPLEEAGERHLFFATSARFSSGSADPTAGVPLESPLENAKGLDGQVGSGVYAISETGECIGDKTLNLLAQMREQGMVELVQETIKADIEGALAADLDSSKNEASS